MKPFTLFFLLILATLTGSAQSSYFPIKAGTEQLYAFSTDFSQGNHQLRTRARILSETKVIAGKKYFIYESAYGTDNAYQVTSTSFIRISGDGSILAKTDANGKEYVLMSNNPKVGDSWSQKLNNSSVQTEVKSLSGNIETPIETYSNCLIIETKSQEAVMRSYYQKGVGMVAITMVISGKEKLFSYLI